MSSTQIAAPRRTAAAAGVMMPVLAAISVAHLLNDLMQALLPALYPLFKLRFGLSFAQVGLLTFCFQTTASLFQPVIGHVTDRRPMPFSLPVAMAFTLAGLLLLSVAESYGWLLVAAAVVGLGSSIFHPEASRVVRLASGGRFGFAQSLFSVGGNFGQAMGPLLAAFVVVPLGQHAVALFSLVAVAGMVLLGMVGRWYSRHLAAVRGRAMAVANRLSRTRVYISVAVLLALMVSKFVYLASINTFFTFYLIGKFHMGVQAAQLHLFVFLGSVAAGGLAGGPIGDRVGRKYVIWGSILGVLPCTLVLPYADLVQTDVLIVVIGAVLASAFSAIVVYAQELMPDRVGMVSGLFFGGAFGVGGLAAAGLGVLADHTGIEFVYRLCSFLPVLGVLSVFLPSMQVRPGQPRRGGVSASR